MQLKYKSFLNYIGQLRVYSFLDILVFGTALTKNLSEVFGIGLLWLSFLLYLESRHKDKPRLHINKYLWILPFIFSLTQLPIWVCLMFGLFSYVYTKKKENKFFGATAPLWRGLQNGVIAISFNYQLAVLAFILTFIRNLIADFRDANSDKQRNIKTIAVLWGVNKNQIWAFYVHILLVNITTIIWFQFSFLNTYLILPIILIQLLSYPLTPRLSNPKYLDIYADEK